VDEKLFAYNAYSALVAYRGRKSNPRMPNLTNATSITAIIANRAFSFSLQSDRDGLEEGGSEECARSFRMKI